MNLLAGLAQKKTIKQMNTSDKVVLIFAGSCH